MKQVNLTLLFLLTAFVAFGQTVTPDPGPYAPMNQKYEYRWIKTSGGIWNIGKFVQGDSAQFTGIVYVPTVLNSDSSIKAANTAWVKRFFATSNTGSLSKWDTAGNAGLDDPRLGTTDNTPFALVTNNIKRLIMPAAGILAADSNYVFLVKDTLNGDLKYTTSGGGGGSTDTTSLSNRINLKLNISDTAAMLSPYSRVTVSSYGKNAGGDSTILLLSNGSRYAAKDSVGSGGASGWGLTGNAALDTTTNFLGTTDSVGIRFRVAGVRSGIISASYRNTAFGYKNQLLNSGVNNNSFGYEALTSNTYGSSNNAFGWNALNSNTTGNFNIAMGTNALSNNTTGSTNVGIGGFSLYINSTGTDNTAIGYNALGSNNGSSNTAIGATALNFNTSGSNNVAMGFSALVSNTSGSNNTAVGANALLSSVSTWYNSAFGFQALRFNTGTGNTGLGFNTLWGKEAGNYNTAIGYNTGFDQADGSYNYLIGASVQAPNLSGSGQLNIGNVIYGTGMHQSTTNSSTPTTAGAISIGATAPAASAVLDITSTTKGFLIPRMTTTQRNAISSPATALQVFSTTDSTNYIYRGTTSGWQATITGIRGSGTLDFGSIAHHSEEVLTFTVTGAAEGDVVSLGVPNASNLTNVIYTAWVSAANTVTVKCSNLDQSAAKDPASGTFKVTVLK